MFPENFPTESAGKVRHDPEGGLTYQVDKVVASTDGYESARNLNGRRRVSYTKLEDGGFPAGTEWNKDEAEFRANFTPIDDNGNTSI